MKIRTQLVLAFLLLAAVPLAVIVGYSYVTSLAAFRRAVTAEAQGLAEEMRRRLGEAREELGERVAGLGRLPLAALTSPRERAVAAARAYVELVAEMGELAEVVESFEFQPVGEGATPGASVIIHPSRTLAEALRRLEARAEGEMADAGLSAGFLAATVGEAIRARDELDSEELAALEAREEQTRAILGTEFTVPVVGEEGEIGQLTAHVRAYPMLREVLARTRQGEGEIPYARDDRGNVYLADARDREVLDSIGVIAGEGDGGVSAGVGLAADDRWIVAEPGAVDPELSFGIVRPVGDSLEEIRRTAASNFLFGSVVVAVALAGIALLSRRLTRNLAVLARGAERLATGDFQVRVPVRSRDELGQLAATFNRMARELSENQQRLLEQKLERRLLEAENERQTAELEEARRFQLALLPGSVPHHPRLEIAVFMRTATEVGGDYYDFLESGEVLTTVIGDATGHGAKPGTMVSVVKGLVSLGGDSPRLSDFLADANRSIKRMGLGRMQMSLALARFAADRLTLAAAGMPPALLLRAGRGEVEEVELSGMPLGGLADFRYPEWAASVGAGDTLLLTTDGLPELAAPSGEPFGYPRVCAAFAEAGAEAPQAVIDHLAGEAERWRRGAAVRDDITFVVLRVRG